MTELLFPEWRQDRRTCVFSRGVLSRWLVADGSSVCSGQCLAEVRMGEAGGWVAASAPGTLRHQATEGEVLMSGIPIGLIE